MEALSSTGIYASRTYVLSEFHPLRQTRTDRLHIFNVAFKFFNQITTHNCISLPDHDEEILVDKTVPFDDGRDEAPKGDDPDVDMMEELLGQLQAEGEDRPAGKSPGGWSMLENIKQDVQLIGGANLHTFTFSFMFGGMLVICCLFIDLDPEMVKRTEDQIFTKIKFYKDVGYCRNSNIRAIDIQPLVYILCVSKGVHTHINLRLHTAYQPDQLNVMLSTPDCIFCRSYR